MTGIWANKGDGWRLLSTSDYPDEATLHDLVEEAPQMLPLSGTPNLAVLGREPYLGSGYADLIAVETSGRLAIIEVKLARNAEARRAVVAQVLAYAAYLHGLDANDLQNRVLSRHLQKLGHDSVLAAAKSVDQEGAIDDQEFTGALQTNLREGRFRLVFVLDDAPSELVRLVAYLEAVSDKIVIDLITVRAYEVNGARVVLPQRVTPERVKAGTAESTAGRPTKPEGEWTEGAGVFEASIEQARLEHQPVLRRMLAWARSFEAQGLMHLSTYRGISGRFTLLTRIPGEGAGLVTVYNDLNSAYLAFYRSVFERLAPEHIPLVEAVIAPAKVGQGTTTREVNDAVLNAVGAAYEAVGRSRGGGP